jgi:addiction module HigA family antidote
MKTIKEQEKGFMTEPMDIGSAGFNDLQAKLLERSKSRSKDQKNDIKLLSVKYRMEDYLNQDNANEKKAGDFLREYLQELNIRQNRFANYIGLKPSNLNKLIKGDRPINFDLAILFGRIFKNDPMLWIEIQAKNEIRKVKLEMKNKYNSYSLNDLLNDNQEVG